MMLFDKDGDVITKEQCMTRAVERLDTATYAAHGEMDKLTCTVQAIAWMMMADRAEPEEVPIQNLLD
jgi:hypothetical protein